MPLVLLVPYAFMRSCYARLSPLQADFFMISQQIHSLLRCGTILFNRSVYTIMNCKLNVLLLQLPVPNNPRLNTPLAGGYLKAYAYAQGLLDHVEIEFVPRSLVDYAGDAALINYLVAQAPDVLGVSLYTWNSERSLHIVGRVKEQLPDLQVVVGGPEVQRDNAWVIEHPAVDVAVLGEGEQTFADLLQLWINQRTPIDDYIPLAADHTANPLAHVPGIAYQHNNQLHVSAERVALSDLACVPSPYLLGYLPVPADGMLMVEISRWCPYQCSFCLYGRNMGPKLGNRYFDLARVVDEIAWGRQQGIQKVHFVEANLNLVPLFWPLMHALHDLNADRYMTFYAELRGEHLTDEVVRALDQANVRFVEVGLQTANPVALHASHRRTNLQKWAAGTRRLYAHNIEVFLDVIVGLPGDDQAGVAETLDFIAREGLGPHDVFTLQVLPGTAVRQQAAQYGLQFQDRPPYYVLETDRLSYTDVRRLRRDLKQSSGLAPYGVEGLPVPRPTALVQRSTHELSELVDHIRLAADTPLLAAEQIGAKLAHHVDVVIRADELALWTATICLWIAHNPHVTLDVYVVCDDTPPSAAALQQWRDALPYLPGYLDRVAVYLKREPGVGHRRVSPRVFVVLPWTVPIDPDVYQDVALLIWKFELHENDVVPWGAWTAAGGAGIFLHFAAGCSDGYRAQVRAEVAAWESETGRTVWFAEQVDVHDVSLRDNDPIPAAT
jgi:radical SAM superfamily enzyme YgiQ (UPF0313 family)